MSAITVSSSAFASASADPKGMKTFHAWVADSNNDLDNISRMCLHYIFIGELFEEEQISMEVLVEMLHNSSHLAKFSRKAKNDKVDTPPSFNEVFYNEFMDDLWKVVSSFREKCQTTDVNEDEFLDIFREYCKKANSFAKGIVNKREHSYFLLGGMTVDTISNLYSFIGLLVWMNTMYNSDSCLVWAKVMADVESHVNEFQQFRHCGGLVNSYLAVLYLCFKYAKVSSKNYMFRSFSFLLKNNWYSLTLGSECSDFILSMTTVYDDIARSVGKNPGCKRNTKKALEEDGEIQIKKKPKAELPIFGKINLSEVQLDSMCDV